MLAARYLIMAALLVCIAGRAPAAAGVAWETTWQAAQAAWDEHEDGESALALLEEAIALRPPAAAEESMLKELMLVLESVRDEQRVVAALERVHAVLFARHGYSSHAALSIAAALTTAKAAMQDVEGALRHASQVVETVIVALQQLELAETEQLDGEGVAVLEETLSRMTQLYAHHGRLDLAADTSRKALQVAGKIYGPSHLKVAELKAATATFLLETDARGEAHKLLEEAREVLQRERQELLKAQPDGQGKGDVRDENESSVDDTLSLTLEKLALCHREMNQSDQALAHLVERRALRGTQDEVADVERNIAVILARKGELEQASEHYRASLELLNASDARRRSSVLESLGNIALLQSNFSQALAWHTEALALASKDPTLSAEQLAQHWQSVSSCHIRLGDLGAARQALISVLQALFRWIVA
jgi:tetratricopeptide (TPR) repeat protein